MLYKNCIGEEKGLVADKANVVASNGAMKVAVAQDKNGIGYMSIGFVDETVKAPLLDIAVLRYGKRHRYHAPLLSE